MNTISIASQRASALAIAALVALSFGLSGCKGSTGATGAAGAAPAVQQPTGTIQGRLIDSVTQQPIVGAVVDIGVANGLATTNVDGQFTMTNVVVPVDANNAGVAWTGAYYATINMKGVSSPVNMASAVTATNPHYPDFSYQNIPVTFTNLYLTAASSVTATPVTGLIATVNAKVGKLDDSISGIVVDSKTLQPVATAYTVSLYSNIGSANSSTGAANNVVVATTTTSTAAATLGTFSFSNIEAGQSFKIVACDSFTAPTSCTGGLSTLAGGVVVATPNADNQTLTLTQLQNNPITVASTNAQVPTLVSATPMNNTDIGAVSTVNVVYTFSSAIDTTQPGADTVASTANATSLYNTISVNYMGAKASNIPYSLAWSAAGTVLTVSLPSLSPASKYTVILPFANLKNVNNIVATDPSTLATVNFTTSGATQPAAVGTVTVTNSATINYNTPSVSFLWAPVPAAASYNVYRSANYLGMTGSPELIGASTGNIPAYTDTAGTKGINSTGNPVCVMNGGLATCSTFIIGPSAASYTYTVKSVSADKIESAASPSVAVSDVVAPTIVTPVSPIGILTTQVITFSEPIDVSVAPTITTTAAVTIANAVFNGAAGSATTLTVTLSAAPVAGTTMTISGVKDIKGNAMAAAVLTF